MARTSKVCTLGLEVTIGETNIMLGGHIVQITVYIQITLPACDDEVILAHLPRLPKFSSYLLTCWHSLPKSNSPQSPLGYEASRLGYRFVT